MESILHMDKKTTNGRINPQLFSLWVAMASMVMFFGAFTSAYIVKQSAGNWLEFAIPNYFYFSTAAILLSSVVLHWAFISFQKGREQLYKTGLIAALILGTAFMVLQYFGWQDLFTRGIDFRMNVSGSFFYLITGVHAAHVLGGIAAITVALIHAYSLKFEQNEKRENRFRMTVHYWHFVDLLWIYLLIFLNVIK